MCTPSNNLVTFTPSTKAAFLQHLREKSTNRHMTQTDKDIIIEWLTNPHKRPSSQKEFSRRNYILKTFAWDEKTQSLFAAAKTDAAKDRIVVTENTIADVVEFVHENNKHGGWDATWRDISSSYYGILRSDVIYLLKQCQTCALNPSKRPKGSAATIPSSQPIDHEPLGFLSTGEVEYDISAWDVQVNGEHSGE